jgi:hypothetical protein
MKRSTLNSSNCPATCKQHWRPRRGSWNIGPMLGRPHVDTLKNSRHGNMKELRFDAADAHGVLPSLSTRCARPSLFSVRHPNPRLQNFRGVERGTPIPIPVLGLMPLRTLRSRSADAATRIAAHDPRCPEAGEDQAGGTAAKRHDAAYLRWCSNISHRRRTRCLLTRG